MDEADEIFKITRHNKLLCELKRAGAEKQCEELVKNIIDMVGKSGDKDKLYYRRNNYTHSVWTGTEDGKKLCHRVGGEEWREPIPTDGIEQLISELERAAKDIEKATKHLL